MNDIIRADIQRICEEKLPWDNLRNKTVLVTGGTGFIGSYLIYTLLRLNDLYDLGVKTVAMCRSERKCREIFGGFEGRTEFQTYIHDICENLDDAPRCDYIIHTASPASIDLFKKDPYSVEQANIFGMFHLIEAARRWNSKKIILFSSVAVYGWTQPRETLETYRAALDFTAVDNAYPLSKQTAELIARTAAEEFNMDISTVRPYYIYGPGIRCSQKKHLTDFVEKYLRKEPIILSGDGEDLRSYCYISDAVKAVFYVLFFGGSGESYNVASKRNVSRILDVARLIGERGELEVKVGQRPQGTAITMQVGNIQKLLDLGWKDETSLEEGIQRTLRWAENSDFLIS